MSETPKRSRIKSIDHLRVYAAFTVLYGHVLHVLGESRLFDASTPTYYRQGVGPIVFLAIATLIALYTSRDNFGSLASSKDYLVKRLLRLIPLYWIFTTLFLGVDVILPGQVDHNELGIGHAVCSYLFVPYPRPGDGHMRPLLNPGWVLNYIVPFHVMFALCLMLPKRIGLFLVVAIPLGLYFTGLLLFPFVGNAAVAALTPSEGSKQPTDSVTLLAQFFTSRYMFVLVLGMVCLPIHDALRGRVSIPVPLSAALVAMLFVGSWVVSNYQGDYWSIGCAFAILIIGCLTASFRTQNWFTRTWESMATSAYSIYLSQAFTLSGFVIVTKKLGVLGAMPYPVAVVVTMVFALAAGVLVYHVLEKPLNAWVNRVFRPGPRPAAAAAQAPSATAIVPPAPASSPPRG